MKKLIGTIFAVFFACSLNVHAGSADFTWVIPDPAFAEPVPTDWIIDEYRIYCTVDPGNGAAKVQYNQVVYGYTTDAASYNDIPGGLLECYMTSWSIKANAESVPSNIVSKFILNATTPGPPTNLDFTPKPPSNSGGASLIDNSDPVARAEAKRQRQMERKRQKQMNSNNRFETQK